MPRYASSERRSTGTDCSVHPGREFYAPRADSRWYARVASQVTIGRSVEESARSEVSASKLKRMPTNDDVVEAFVYLASPRADFLTGVALPVDGGKSAGV
jgi:NAD(P)-dependent dehydrogenase (short-subunit alcohol dehydrogenase family)